MEKTRFRAIREDKDIRQRDIAKLLNMTQQHYSRIENNIHELSYDGLIKLAIFYDTSIDYLLNLTNEKKAYTRSSKILWKRF